MNHGSAHDTLRWGDTEAIVGLEQLNGELGVQLPTKQLVAAHWRWPLVWLCQVIIRPQLATPGTTNLLIHLPITIGVGQGQQEFEKTYVVIPNGSGVYPAFILDSFQLPAQDIQSRMSVEQTAGVATAGDNVQLGFFVAPVTEPHAMTAMLDELARGQGPQEPQFMTGPFVEQPLGYRGPDGTVYPAYPENRVKY